MPISLMGFTPAGPLDNFHYAAAGYDCADNYSVFLVASNNSCAIGPYVEMNFRFPQGATEPQSGTFAGSAYYVTTDGTTTFAPQGTFAAQEVDPPYIAPVRVMGRFTVIDPGWSIDVSVDLVAHPELCD